MSTPSATVVNSGGNPIAHATGMNGGGLALSPLPVSGGRKRSRKMTKKMKKMLKTLKKLKGGEVGDMADTANLNESGLNNMSTDEGGRRRRGSRKSRRGSRKGRRAGLFY
jgi:hypothetical protein